MKVCVIGNSRVASIKKGFEAFISDTKKPIKVDYYAARGSSLKDLEQDDCYLVPKTTRLQKALASTSGRSGSISLKEYDVFYSMVCTYSLSFILVASIPRL